MTNYINCFSKNIIPQNANVITIDPISRINKPRTLILPVVGVIEDLAEKVYAFNTNYLTAHILMIITIVALVLAGFRIANLMFNLVFHQILAPLVFASDLNNSGRSKKFIKNMLSTYIVFIVILFLMVLFLDITAWAMSDTVSIVGNPLGSVLLKIFIVGGCAKGLIDGPDLIVSMISMIHSKQLQKVDN